MATNGFEYGGLRIEGVENGYIIYSGTEKYIFTTIASALKFIHEAFKGDKK